MWYICTCTICFEPSPSRIDLLRTSYCFASQSLLFVTCVFAHPEQKEKEDIAAARFQALISSLRLQRPRWPQQILGLSTLRLPQSMRHDIIIIFCWWTSNDIKCMIMRVCHVSPTCFFGNIILETMNIIWTSWTLTTCMCKSQRDWSKWRSGSVYRCSNSRSFGFAASWGTTSTISTSTSVTQSSTTTSTTLWWAQMTSKTLIA